MLRKKGGGVVTLRETMLRQCTKYVYTRSLESNFNMQWINAILIAIY